MAPLALAVLAVPVVLLELTLTQTGPHPLSVLESGLLAAVVAAVDMERVVLAVRALVGTETSMPLLVPLTVAAAVAAAIIPQVPAATVVLAA